MIKEAMQWIKEQTLPEMIEVEGRTYCTRDLFKVRQPRQETLNVHTLQGIIDYLAANPDGLQLGDGRVFIHILNPDGVGLIHRVTPDYLLRPIIVNAQPVLPDLRFGDYSPAEAFLISLKSRFVQTDALLQLVQVVGNVRAEGGVHQEDDGFTQKVTARQQAARVGEVQVPNPVSLAPYRTFQEVEQPESPFVFRMKIGEGGGVSCALFEADGGAWRIEAVARVEHWLKSAIAAGKSIPDIAVIR